MNDPSAPGAGLRLLSVEQAVGVFRHRRRLDADTAATTESVRSIILRVQEEGDAALSALTEKFDRCRLAPDAFRIPESALAEAWERLPGDLAEALRTAHHRLLEFHRHQVRSSWFFPSRIGQSENAPRKDCGLLGQLVTPLDAVGIYVPGGKAPYPSTVLMNAVPASLAGVPRIVMMTPPDAEGRVQDAVLGAAWLCGIREVYRIGGAQAIAALALGTQSIAPVDKISGPGNRYVAEAKRLLFGVVGIDMIAGPSDVLVFADDHNDPDLVAADLLSQAEHDEDAACVLVSPSRGLIERVNEAIAARVAVAPRGTIIRRSLENNGLAILVADHAEAFRIINLAAPEHLEILADCALETVLEQVRHAGAIFYGPWSPEPIGDYLAGPNHTLPTSGTARFFSPLGVHDFVKQSSLIALRREGFTGLAKAAIRLAEAEGFDAHAEAIRVRMKGDA